MDYSEWPKKPEKLDSKMVGLFERFLLGSLAIGASSMSSGFIDVLKLTSSALAEGYLKRLEGAGVSFTFKDNAVEVEKAVESFGCDPWDICLSPYFIAVRTDKDETISKVKSLSEYVQVSGSGLSDEASPIIRRRFIEVDSVYRHLRNALAHGCFRCISQEKGSDTERLFFYDISKNKKVSCCALVPVEVLNGWYQISCDVAKKKL